MAQELKTIISLTGRVDNSFGKMGQELYNLGVQIDQFGQHIRAFMLDNLSEFMEYDDIMRYVQALGEYGDRTMQALDAYNREIAASSRYTMEQAAQAEMMIAQLGLGLEDTKALMPVVMSLATAGNMDLATSLEYLYYSLSALGMPMSSAQQFADQMAKTAAISSADINTLGESFQRLGSGSRYFAGGSAEILAILAGLSQFGEDMQGTNVGTQLRNFMLTLMAPTGSKSQLMKELKITEEEWAEFVSDMAEADVDITDTKRAMDQLGLSVYDANGSLKPAIQIIGEMKAALAGLPLEEQNAFLAKMFGKRTTITAQNLLTVFEQILGFQQAIAGGSDGYTQQMVDTIEGGLGGAYRQVQSSLNALQTIMGSHAAPGAEKALEGLTGFINAVADMPEAQMDGLVTGLSTISVLGPGLMAVGGAVKLIGMLGTPAGWVALGVAAAAAAAGLHSFITTANQLSFESRFGTMELDVKTLSNHVSAISAQFRGAYKVMDEFGAEVDAAVSNYTAAAAEMSGSLVTGMITGAKLTDADKTSLTALGSAMGTELVNAIGASIGESVSYWNLLFTEDPDSEDYRAAVDALGRAEVNLTAEAKALGAELGSMLGEAMDDSIITGDEYKAIMDKMALYDQAMASVAAADAAEEMAWKLHQASSVSWDSASGFLAATAESLEADKAYETERYVRQQGRMQHLFETGQLTHEDGSLWTQAQFEQTMAAMQAEHQENIAGIEAKYGQIYARSFEALIGQSGYADAWRLLSADSTDWTALDAAGLLPEGILEQLADLIAYGGDFYDLLEGYASDPAVAKMLRQLESAGEAERQLAAYQEQKRFFIESGGQVDPYNFFSTSRERELRLQIEAAEKALAALKDNEAALQAEIDAGRASPGISYEEQLAAERAAREVKETELTGLRAQLHDEMQSRLGAPGVVIPAAVSQAGSANAAMQAVLDASPLTQTVNVTFNTEEAPPLPWRKRTLDGYAEGGRATVPSVFGEAGPEWAIPEEHTDRVAGLLNAARAAAGFTWPELIGRNGGLNAGGGGGAQIVYSPTIVTQNADGVEDRLREDKARFARWWREQQLRDAVEVYA